MDVTMTFEHEPVRSPVKLKRVNIEGKRYYDNGSGSVYPSVTSVTGLHNLDAIKAWPLKSLTPKRNTSEKQKADHTDNL